MTGGLRGQTDYDVTSLTPNHQYRLTLSTRSESGSNGCLGKAGAVTTAITPSTADFGACSAYASTAEAQRADMLKKGCTAEGAMWDPTGTPT